MLWQAKTADGMLEGVLKNDCELLKTLHEYTEECHKIPILATHDAKPEDERLV